MRGIRRAGGVIVASVLVLGLGSCDHGTEIIFDDGTAGTGLCRVDVARLDFGIVTVDSTEQRTISIRNIGDGTYSARIVQSYWPTGRSSSRTNVGSPTWLGPLLPPSVACGPGVCGVATSTAIGP